MVRATYAHSVEVNLDDLPAGKPAVEPEPSKSRSRNLGYDPARNVFILETSGAKSNRPEIWTSGRFEKDGQPIGSRTYFQPKLKVL